MTSKMLGQLYMCAAMGALAANMGGGGYNLPSSEYVKTPLNSRQKKRRKNAKLARKSRKRNRK